jgi:hypothetical protein
MGSGNFSDDSYCGSNGSGGNWAGSDTFYAFDTYFLGSLTLAFFCFLAG